MSSAGPRGAAAGPRPIGTLLYVPLLYGAGWLLSRPLAWLAPSWRTDQVDLAGAGIALALLLLSLPLRLRRVWGEPQPWRRLGLAVGWRRGSRAFAGGLLAAVLLLAAVTAVLLLSGQARWQGQIQIGPLANALALLLGVGFAEELVFRGWLWGELALLLPPRRAVGLQAALFALAHPWYRAGGTASLALLSGLVLLGLALARQRRAAGGALGAAVGLHGGLVGGWFLLQVPHGLLQLNPSAPAWLVGPGAASPNPIGGLPGLLALAVLLAWQQRQPAITGESTTN